ncbi:hypothetical protein WKH31_19110 [Metabacillus indicus]|uniref:hypothetical protein n=1 Tax=Metabacillus indicus TaxID=246786 RepID=UPI00316D01A6
MEVRLLEKGYKNLDSLYPDFLEGKVNEKEEYFSDKVVYIREAPDFPIYMGRGSEEERRKSFLKAFQIISQSYLNTERDLLLDETFWHSLLLTNKQDFILMEYPEVAEKENTFRNVVLKKFDWENYIYKVILGAQYINDNITDQEARLKYYELIIENLDLYNYMIKYEIFRNDHFLINILRIIDELDLSKVLKAKIKGREDLGDDERVGRRVIFEFNKSYPVIMSPMLEKEELKKLFIEYLSYYHDISELLPDQEYSFKEIAADFADDEFVFTDMSAASYNLDTEVSVLDDKNDVIYEKQEKSEVISKENLLNYLDSHGLEYVDHRTKGGSLWVVGNKGIENSLKPLEKAGVRFKFKPTGGKASSYRPAWFWYDK